MNVKERFLSIGRGEILGNMLLGPRLCNCVALLGVEERKGLMAVVITQVQQAKRMENSFKYVNLFWEGKSRKE